MTLHSCRNGVVIPFLQEWCGHSIPAGMELSFHSCRNGVVIPFLQEWDESIPFLQEWNDHSIPAGIENGNITPFLQESLQADFVSLGVRA